jgi:hypothetical protein
MLLAEANRFAVYLGFAVPVSGFSGPVLFQEPGGVSIR